MKIFLTRVSRVACLGILLIGSTSFAQLDSELSVNVKDTPLRNVLELVAAKTGLQLVVGQDPNVNISMSQSGTTAKQVLDKIASEQQIEYTITGNQLFVTKRGSVTNLGDSHLIKLNYAVASEVFTKLKTVLSTDERLIVDDRENNVIFIGPNTKFEKIKSIVALLDAQPKQIMMKLLIRLCNN